MAWKKVDPDPIVTCCSNVIFLPGIDASTLYTKNSKGTNNKLWEPNRNLDVEKLYLDEKGNSLDSEIYVGDIIESAYGFKKIYKKKKYI